MMQGMAGATNPTVSSSDPLSPSGSGTGGIIILIACVLRARLKVSTHIAGTTHKAGATAGPEDDDDAEDDEAGPTGGAKGGEEELEEAPPCCMTAGSDEAGPIGTTGASGMPAGKPAATRARATSTSAATLAFH